MEQQLAWTDHDMKMLSKPELADRLRIAALAHQPVAPVEVDAHKATLASLVAAVSLLRRGGGSAAPSDVMFNMMLADYEKSIEASRDALTQQPAAGTHAGFVKWFNDCGVQDRPPSQLARAAWDAALSSQQPGAVDEAMVFRLAVWMAKHDGHDDPHHLIRRGNPPEPRGEVWNRYEDDARAALTAAFAAQPGGSDNG